jgi:hypothetical protein
MERSSSYLRCVSAPPMLIVILCQLGCFVSLVPDIELCDLETKMRHLNTLPLHDALQQPSNSNYAGVQVCGQELVMNQVVVVRSFKPPARSLHLGVRQMKTAKLGRRHKVFDRDCFEIEVEKSASWMAAVCSDGLGVLGPGSRVEGWREELGHG